MEEAEELVNRIVADPALYEPVHCPGGHEVMLKRFDMTPHDVAKSRERVKVIALKLASKKNLAIGALAASFAWTAAEYWFWWF